MTGNFYCVSSSCARVVWREYLPGGIRYRYEGEDWIYVDGDDYSTNNTLDFGNNSFHVYVDATLGIYTRSNLAYQFQSYSCGDTLTLRTRLPVNGGKLIDYKVVQVEQYNPTGILPPAEVLLIFDNNDTKTINFQYPDPNGNYPNYLTNAFYLEGCTADSQWFFATRIGVNNLRNIRFEGLNNNLPPETSCTFTIYKNGEIVHKETRDNCPEVEQIDCRLSEQVNEIRIEKIPFLQRIEVVPYLYGTLIPDDYTSDGQTVEIFDIPPECLNIYKSWITDPTPNSIVNNNFQPGLYDFIDEICSEIGCPPPEYEIICDCDCESCPDGTCAVSCDDHICCYDTSRGIAVQQIEIDKYCKDEN